MPLGAWGFKSPLGHRNTGLIQNARWGVSRLDTPHRAIDWQDASLGGTWIRVAAWLVSEVGEGSVFTKQQLREAFPGVEQVDRRMRDLRPYGWIIDDYRQAADLRPQELRLVRVGVPVWDRDQRRAAAPSTISARLRQDVFARDGHMCRRCGIAAGEPFDDDPNMRARMTAAHIYPASLSRDDVTADDLVTACQRCNEALRQNTANYLDGDQVWQRIRDLGRSDKRGLLGWMEQGRRSPSPVEQVFAQWLQLPATQRDSVKDRLSQQVPDA